MGLWQNLKAMKAMATSGYRGAGPTPEALAALTPEQQEAYRAQLAEAEAATARVAEVAARRYASRPLQGPAGEHLYQDTTPAASAADLAAMSTAEVLALESQRQKEMFGDLLRNPFGGREPPPPPPPVSADPAQQAAAELAARTAARVPYLAPERGAIRITRIPASGLDADEVATFLASSGLGARPDLVFGAYRVPDHHTASAMLGSARAYVEWDVVHADVGPLPPAPAPESVLLPAEEHWVERRVGEPSILDEDLAVTYLASAGIGPDATFGIARRMEVLGVGGSGESGGATIAHVTGVHVLHLAAGPAGAALERFRSSRPIPVPFAGVAGVHVEVLNWDAVARAVHPHTHRRAPIPSPFPYLPGTAQELLVSYLEVVGVHPAHCYAAAVVESGPRAIDGYGNAGPFTTKTNVGTEEVCVDGEARRRLHAGRHVVIAHLDAPAYVEGRSRWAAYQRDVLQATLEHETGARRPVEPGRLDDLPSGLRGVVRTVEVVGELIDGDHDPFLDHPRHRYCWPPVG